MPIGNGSVQKDGWTTRESPSDHTDVRAGWHPRPCGDAVDMCSVDTVDTVYARQLLES